MKKIVKINGMHCPKCENPIKKKLNDATNILKVKIFAKPLTVSTNNAKHQRYFRNQIQNGN